MHILDAPQIFMHTLDASHIYSHPIKAVTAVTAVASKHQTGFRFEHTIYEHIKVYKVQAHKVLPYC